MTAQPPSQFDVAIVGGSFAGMAAALQVARARRSVIVIDGGQRRNRFANESHGFLSRDGESPNEIARIAREQLLAYPNVTWRDGLVADVSGSEGAFTVATKSGEELGARYVVLASGVVDNLPDIDGLAERWGTVAFTCPYCHGYELNQGNIAVIATSPMSYHHAWMFPEWGKVTFFTNNSIELDDEQRTALKSRNVDIVSSPINRISGHASIEIADGNIRDFVGIAISGALTMSDLPRNLGCELGESPQGPFVNVDALQMTTVPGVFACGDIARPMHNIALAVADGTLAGTAVHRSLMLSD